MKKILSLFISAAAIVALSGCAGTGDTDGLGGASLVNNGSFSGSIGTYDSSINVLNSASSDQDICHVYSAPSSSSNWAELTGTPIAPGDDRTWSTDNCNISWDLKVVDCAGNFDIRTYDRDCYTTTYFTFTNW